MIKRFWFSAESAESPWVHLAREAGEAAPIRLVACIPLEDTGREQPQVGGFDIARIDIAWFDDVGHLARFDAATEGATDGATDDGVVALDAEEVVLRGATWLENRWTDPGVRFKHLALAHRAPGLSAQEFSDRWRAHAGSLGSTTIPAEIRGDAYVQNHPIVGAGHPPRRLDAINEVWFGDIDTLRARTEWFARNAQEPADDGLFGERGFLGVEERALALD